MTSLITNDFRVVLI